MVKAPTLRATPKVSKTKTVVPFARSFASFDTHKVSAWSNHNKLRPNEVFKYSKVKYIFDCAECGHAFEASLANVAKGAWCGYCSGINLCGDPDCQQCIERSFASYHNTSKVAMWSERNEDKPHEVTIRSAKMRWFSCIVCKHDFEIRLYSVTGHQECWCPYCAGFKLCDKEDCLQCFPRSFASRCIRNTVQLWSSANTIKPRQVPITSKDLFWFNCQSCNQEFEKAPVSCKAESWCSFCKSFASFSDQDKVNMWSVKNPDQPHQLTISSNNIRIFDCDLCHHEFEIRICAITSSQGSWCPYCARQKLCNNSENCNHCFERSFAAFQDLSKVSSWSKENDDQPHQVSIASKKERIFDCVTCLRTFQSTISNITLNGNWCPFCKANKMMLEFIQAVESVSPSANITLEETVRCNNRALRIDAKVEFGMKYFYFESDGPQHFTPMPKMLRCTEEEAIVKFKDQVDRDR
ncbi:unnamed protein product, partial [Phaeothamnion confervicola]